jgi:hypothetical protein
MPQRPWTGRRQRQYLHISAGQIKAGLREHGEPDDVAGNIAGDLAARAVKKERARHGETKMRSRSSSDDMSSTRR